MCVCASVRVYSAAMFDKKLRVRWLNHVSDAQDRSSLFLVFSLLLSLPSCSWADPLPLIGRVGETEGTDVHTQRIHPFPPLSKSTLG